MAMTMAELHALPSVVNLETAGRAIGCSRAKAYELHASGEFPVTVRQVVSPARVMGPLVCHEHGTGLFRL